MAKAKAVSVNELTQATGEAPRDAFGRLLDAWGLPVNGPCRAAALESLNLPDPHDDPDAWRKADVPEPLPIGLSTSEPMAEPLAEIEAGNLAGFGDDQDKEMNDAS